MKNIHLFSLIIVVIIIGFACSKPTQPPKYSFFNYSPDSPRLLLSIDGSSMYNEGIEYTKQTSYAPYIYENKGSQSLEIKSANSGATYLSNTINMQDYYNYSIFACGSILNMDYVMLNDYNEAADYSKCKVRFVNLCPDCGDVNITLDGTNYFGAQPFKGASSFIAIESDTLQAIATNTSGDMITVDREKVYNKYKLVNLVLTGNKTGTGLYKPVITINEY